MTIPSKIIPFRRSAYPALVPSVRVSAYPRFKAERARSAPAPRILPGSEGKHDQRPLN
ncbi:hypothetical protein DEVEQU_00114 [Devosia equisanguinis]|uniref:Uncharacterized protein n=1 Tax=Devosia equisanguinis TaxID=2490941 RepID=A0A3S4CAT8_9HYPH|nr:hypothetical protein DEVEQU_00114 [Devosia equisanguinis]